jgi:hypothetical protein
MARIAGFSPRKANILAIEINKTRLLRARFGPQGKRVFYEKFRERVADGHALGLLS